MSKSYGFQYINWAAQGGASRPSNSVAAESDEEAYRKIKEFLDAETGRELVPDTIKMVEHRDVPDPSWASSYKVGRAVAEASQLY